VGGLIPRGAETRPRALTGAGGPVSNISIGEGSGFSVKVSAVAMALVLSSAWMAGDLQAGESRLYLAICTFDDRLLVEEPVHLGQKITIVYNHSVERVPVLEVSQVRGVGPLYLSTLISREPLLAYPGYEQYYSQRFPWDGISEGPLPHGLDMGQKDWFIVKGIERARVMPLMVGSRLVDHKILIGSKVLSLRKVAGSGEIVKIFVKEK
jgi:hypothetical protein